jgi:RNA polymerase sigma-70 factor (family 1)
LSALFSSIGPASGFLLSLSLMDLVSTIPDARLAAALRRGSARAFTAIYEQYWEKLFAIAYHFCQNKETAEEVVQELFLSLWDKRAEVLIEDLGAYLATAVKYGVFKQLVRQKRREKLLDTHLHPVTVADETEQVEARFLAEYVAGIVEQLPQQCRVVYQLSRQDGLRVEEIAHVLQISPNTARNHLHKALKTIRQSLRHANGVFILFH